MEIGNIDRRKGHILILKKPLRGCGKIGKAGSDADHQIRLFGDPIGGRVARDADAAQVKRMGGGQCAFAGLRFGKRNMKRPDKPVQRIRRLRVANTPAADDQRFLAVFKQGRHLFQFKRDGLLRANRWTRFLKKLSG